MKDDPGSLSNLRDIAVPGPLPVFPAGPGWTLLALLVLGLSTWTGIRLWRRHQRLAFRREALSLLQEMEAPTAQDISALLKRVALASQPRTAVAGLSGKAWTDWLGAPPQAVDGLLSTYTDPDAAAPPELLEFARAWIQKAPLPPNATL